MSCSVNDEASDGNEMSQVQCVRMRLKPGSLERVREWQQELNHRRSEVMETLRDEQVFIESVFLEHADGQDYLIYYMRGLDLEKSRAVARASVHTIDAYHQAFMKAVRAPDGHSKLECLIDFECPSTADTPE